MSQNQEIIEAKLCAYIDDELDAAGRAELEKHLAANPQHQRLIEELRRTSGLLRTLPRDSAPPDLAEGFNMQLERSVLLGGVAEDVAAADLKSPRWPQLVAMAAITLLTVGLAVVVYFALPGTGGRPQIVQVTPHSTNNSLMSDRDSAVDESQSRSLAKASDLGRSGGERRKAEDQVADAEKSLRERSLGAVVPDPSAASPPSNSPSAYQRHGLDDGALSSVAAGEPAAPIVLVMHTDDPSAARRALVLYLVQQNIAWEPAQAPANVEVLARSDTLGSGLGGGGGRAAAEASTQPASFAAAVAPQPTVDVAKRLALAPAPATRPTTDLADTTTALDGAIPGPAAPAATQPAVAQAQPLPAPAAVVQDQLREAGAPVADANAKTTAPQATLEFSVSCKLTAEQAELLRSSLQLPGTSIDPLPPQPVPFALAGNKDEAVAAEKEKAIGGSLVEQNRFRLFPSDAPAAPAARNAPTASPATSPAALGVAGESVALGAPAPALPSAAVDQAAADRKKNEGEGLLPATRPAAADAALLNVVIVVRPAELPVNPPATAPPATRP
jgi:hypothetical protein